MFGGTLMLLTRSLRLDARRKRTHLFRLFFVGLVFVCLVWAHATSLTVGAPGLEFFRLIALLNFALITLAGTSFFATAITEEKEEGTLGLLKMAGISRVSVLLGKSTSRLITAILLFLVQLPFTLLAITLGGVTLGQIFAAYWALLAYMLLVANLALFFSVLSRRSGNAAGLTAIVLFLFFFIPPAGTRSLGVLATRGTISEGGFVEETATTFFTTLEDASAFNRLQVIMQTGFGESPFGFQVIGNFAAAAVFFAISWVTFDLFTRDTHTFSPERPLVAKRTSPLSRLGLATPRAWTNALMWKDFQFITGGGTMIVVKFVLYGLIIAAIPTLAAAFGMPIRWHRFGGAVGFAMTIAIAVELCVYASRIFHDEVKWGTLPTLLLLPISTVRIAYSKVAGCLLGLLPAVTYFALGFVFSPGPFADVSSEVMCWAWMIEFVLLLHLTVLFSLVVKWGALPLAMAVLVVFQVFCLSPLAVMPLMMIGATSGSEAALIGPMLYLGGTATVVLQFLIGSRLETAAGR